MSSTVDELIRPVVAYADLAACSFFVWDYFITFDMEVELVWKFEWSMIKVLYLMQRYMPFFDSCYLSLYREFAYNLSARQCEIYAYIAAYMYVTGILFSEVLLATRVWAIWKRNVQLGWILPIMLFLIIGASYFATYDYIKSFKYILFPYIIPQFSFQGCYVLRSNNTIIWCWIGLMAWDTVTFLLMFISGIRAYRTGMDSNLTNVIYRDGVFYYMYLLIFSGINIFCAATMPPQTRILVTLLERCLHSTLASRVLLHMRAQLLKPYQHPTSLMDSVELRFKGTDGTFDSSQTMSVV